MNKLKNILVLIDEPLDGDHRVLTSIAKMQNPTIINCLEVKDTVNVFSILITINILFKSFLSSPYNLVLLYKSYNFTLKSFFIGLKTSIKTTYRALKIFNTLKKEYRSNNFQAIYANDLMCGIIGFYLARYFKIELIYDAHEVEFHRNRKNSFFRVAFDMYIERKIIEYSSSIIVVNVPILQLYQKIYNIQKNKINIIDNNHFKPCFNYSIEKYNKENKKISIVYVGAGINGRKLESLVQNNLLTKINLDGFFLSNIPKNALKNGWTIGSKNYLPELKELVKHKKCIMWCCVDNICLSYQLSLPNKFFQAIAIGIPVIAYKGTYLSEIVSEHKLGYIYDNNNLEDIVNNMKKDENYHNLLVSISIFQNKLFKENLEL